MKKKFLARLTPITAAAAMAVMVTSPAQAADPVLISSTVTLSNLTYQLVDLDPTDGITPWVKFATSGNLSVGNLDSDTAFSSTSGLGPSQTITAAAADGSSSALAGPSQLQAYSSIRASEMLPLNTENVNYYERPPLYKSSGAVVAGNMDPDTGETLPSVTLSANTLLIIKGSASLQQTMDLTSLQSALTASGASFLSVYGETNAKVDVHLISTTSTDYSVGSTTVGGATTLGTPYYGFSGSIHATPQDGDAQLTYSFESGLTPFKLSLANTDSTDLGADLGASLYANSSMQVIASYPYTPPPQPAVPEPSTYFLTGLGLIAAGAVARKRNSAIR